MTRTPMRKLQQLPTLYLFLLLLLPAVLLAQEPSTYLYHQVNKEDVSLWRIAQEYETTVAAIQKINKLKTTLIKPQQILVIPAGKFKKYLVKETDKSLWQIAQYYQVPLDSLRKYNALKKDYIHAGDVLLLPTADLVNQAIIHQEEKVVVQKQKTYKIVVHIQDNMLDVKANDKTVCIYLYKQQQKDWLLIDQKYHLELFGAEDVYLGDYDENGEPDVLLLDYVGARAYYSSYNLWVIDDENDRWQRIEGFDKISAPSYDSKEKGFRSSYFSSQTGEEATSEEVYGIDYKTYKVKKKKN